MIPQKLKPAAVLKVATDAAGREGKFISLKNANKVTVVVHIAQGHASTVLLEILQATAVANTGVKAIANAVPIWQCYDTANSDTFTAQTAAVNFTTNAGTVDKIVVFQVDPAVLDVANSFDCITVQTGASNAGNITGAIAYVDSAFGKATPPTVITD
jgi:hypothetical protein